MSNNNNNNSKDVEDSFYEDDPLSKSELRQLRRIIRDDQYARRFKTGFKVWVITFGTVASIVVAGVTLWKELAARIFGLK